MEATLEFVLDGPHEENGSRKNRVKMRNIRSKLEEYELFGELRKLST